MPVASCMQSYELTISTKVANEMAPHRHSNYLNASVRLKQNKERILREWEEAVRKEVPAAQNQSLPALRDTIPKVLDQLIGTLASHSPSNALKPIERRLALEHGQE